MAGADVVVVVLLEQVSVAGLGSAARRRAARLRVVDSTVHAGEARAAGAA